MDIDGLDLRRSLFVAGMIMHGRKRRAAIEAGVPAAGAHVEATRLLKDVKIQQALREAKVTVIEDAMERATIDAAWVLEQLKSLYDTSIGDFMDVGVDGHVDFDFSAATDEQLKCIDTFKTKPGMFGTSIEVGLPKKLAILEMIGKHIDVQAFKDKVEVSERVTLNFDREDEGA